METKALSILLVEDDEVDAEYFIRAFRCHTLMNPLIHALDGIEALRYLRGEVDYFRLPFPCLIFLDLRLPKMNGFEFLRALRQDENLKQSIVFVLTGSAAEADKARLYDQQIAGYIVKEQTRQYCRSVLDLIAFYQQHIQLPTNPCLP